eukprot:scaffold14336_cov115-Isochrysis_galbana.AAC.4
MAPRQLFTQPMEDDNDPEPGSKRVRPSSADEGSMQVRHDKNTCAVGEGWKYLGVPASAEQESGHRNQEDTSGLNKGMLVGWTGITMGERPDPHAPPWGRALGTALTPERWNGRGRSEDQGVEG